MRFLKRKLVSEKERIPEFRGSPSPVIGEGLPKEDDSCTASLCREATLPGEAGWAEAAAWAQEAALPARTGVGEGEGEARGDSA